jgi:hypothetical protein
MLANSQAPTILITAARQALVADSSKQEVRCWQGDQAFGIEPYGLAGEKPAPDFWWLRSRSRYSSRPEGRGFSRRN